jgi:hypothetical protein
MSTWRTTDNRHWDSPARMNDGRQFTDYRSDANVNNYIATTRGFRIGTDDYSRFLQSQEGQALRQSIQQNALIGSASGDRWGRQWGSGLGEQSVRNVPVSRAVDGPPSLDSPQWGLSEDTLALNLRPAVGMGGSTIGWGTPTSFSKSQ